MKQIKSIEYRTLSNGVEIPSIGFGTDRTFIFLRKNIIKGAIDLLKDLTIEKRYHLKRDISITKILNHASDCSCSLFDTASAYGNSERILGHVLKKYKREDLFVITKLSNKEQRCFDVEKAVKHSLKRLQTDYIDLYLMHWPQTDTYIQNWCQMEQIYNRGYARAIGVCNFQIHHLEELKKHSCVTPMVNQVECHPLFSQKDLLTYCQNNRIQFMAYTPTGRMNQMIINNPDLQRIASFYHKSLAQVILRWHIQNGIIPIVNTTKLEHLKDNMNIFDFSLSSEDILTIDKMNINKRLRYDPDLVDFSKC